MDPWGLWDESYPRLAWSAEGHGWVDWASERWCVTDYPWNLLSIHRYSYRHLNQHATWNTPHQQSNDNQIKKHAAGNKQHVRSNVHRGKWEKQQQIKKRKRKKKKRGKKNEQNFDEVHMYVVRCWKKKRILYIFQNISEFLMEGKKMKYELGLTVAMCEVLWAWCDTSIMIDRANSKEIKPQEAPRNCLFPPPTYVRFTLDAVFLEKVTNP